MATQNEGFKPVNFSVTTPFTNFRIMEVTQEIVAIINASKQQGKTAPVLQFKSAPPLGVGKTASLARNTSSGHDKERDSILHLCSENQTWAIKQVSTSNSVYLIRPSKTVTQHVAAYAPVPSDSNNPEDTMDTTTMADATRGSVTATSQVRNFLELHPVKSDISDIARAVLDFVPVYEGTDEEDETRNIYRTHQESRKPPVSAKSLEGSIAAPNTQIQETCTRLNIFETDQQHYLRLPSPTAILEVWSKIIQGCAIEQIRLDHALDAERISSTLEDPTDREIAKVMFRENGTLDQLGLTKSTSSDDSSVSTSSSTQTQTQTQKLRYLKPDETSVFVAKLILRAGAYRRMLQNDDESEANQVAHENNGSNDNGVDSMDFVANWTDLVPSSFVKYCTLDLLRDNKEGETSSLFVAGGSDGTTRLCWPKNATYHDLLLGNVVGDSVSGTGSGGIGETEAGGGGSGVASSSKPAANAKRKWHEKFGAQRVVKR